MNAAGGILDQSKDRPSPVGYEGVLDPGDYPPDRDAAVLHGHEFVHVAGVERPGVDDLLALRIDHFDPLAFADARRFAFPRRDLDHDASPLGLTVDEFSGDC
jgi:hypothetical protein